MKHPKHNMTRRMARHMAILAAGILLLASCAKDEYDFITPDRMPSAGLVLRPSVYEGVAGNGAQDAPKTRADFYDDTSTWQEEVTQVEGDDELKENDLGTKLDVFIAGKDDNFWHEFHLTQGQNFSGLVAKVKNETADLLSDEWRQLGIVPGNRYDVYVAVNNTATNGTIGSKEALLALTNQNTKVFTIYGATSTGQYDAMRRMMMDGHVEWTATEENLQTIDVPLKRAEAKVVVNVMIDPAFYAALKARNNHESPIGTMQWKYVNWTFDSNVFEDGTTDLSDAVLHTNDGRSDATYAGVMNGLTYYHYQDQDVDVCFNEDEIYYGDHNDPNNGKTYHEVYPNATIETVDNVPQFKIITYDYATNWGDNAEERAPFVLLSFPFRKTEGGNVTTSYNYFRVPLCDESKVHELKRNHIYKVDATISGEGSTSLSDNEKDVRLNYQVIDWVTDENEKINVEAKKFYYFYVTPKTYDLRGEGTQSVNLAYYAPANSNVQIKNVKVYYYNKDANQVYQYGGNSTQLNNEFSSFTTPNTVAQPTVITVNTDGTITISSGALANRAVKYISFTAFTTFVDENGQTKTLSEDVFIKHFPTDNIQSVDGWFSYKQDGGTARFIREYSLNPEADGWDTWDGYEDVEVTEAVYEQATEGKYTTTVEEPTGTPSDYDRASTTQSGGNNSQMQSAFRTAVPQNSRQAANSEANAYKDPNSNYWYWGTGSTTTNGNSYDWEGWWYYYRYQNYYRRIYYKNVTHYHATMYYRDVTVNTNWVVWDKDSQNRYNTVKTVYDNIMYAKVYRENYGIYNITQTRNNNGYIANYDELSYTNNHMYIVQISSTSDDYILGRPQMDAATHQSQDHVVSPAFMIASQLGALSIRGSFEAADAATHCSQYVEVAQDGTTYTGWRLPTKEEVGIILQYQQNLPETMANVMTARFYYTLDGDAAENPSPTGNTSTTRFVRCVRDLSPSEVNAINSKR